jgi:hypothetical protein
MKIKHGILFGFTVLLLAAAFTLTSCGDDESGDPSGSGNMTYTIRVYYVDGWSESDHVQKGYNHYVVLEGGKSGGGPSNLETSEWTIDMVGAEKSDTKWGEVQKSARLFTIASDETAQSIRFDATLGGKIVATLTLPVVD